MSASTIKIPAKRTEYMTAGSYTFVVPKNVYVIHAYGAGGGEGGGAGGPDGNRGGRGAIPMFASLDVTPGEVLAVSIGTGGAGSTNLAPRNPGNDTDIRRSIVDVVRFPGAGRYSWALETSGGVYTYTGGAGSAGTAGENSMHATGGSGGALPGSGTASAGPGGGAGYGDGGAGGDVGVNGSNGGISAGGGNAGDGGTVGGNGGNGFLFIWY